MCTTSLEDDRRPPTPCLANIGDSGKILGLGFGTTVRKELGIVLNWSGMESHWSLIASALSNARGGLDRRSVSAIGCCLRAFVSTFARVPVICWPEI